MNTTAAAFQRASIASIPTALALEPKQDLNLPDRSLADRSGTSEPQQMIHALRKAKTRSFSGRDGQVVSWEPGRPRDLVARLVNTGTPSVEISVEYSNGTSRLLDLSTEDDVISITYHCDNDQALACRHCTFDYQLAVNQ